MSDNTSQLEGFEKTPKQGHPKGLYSLFFTEIIKK